MRRIGLMVGLCAALLVPSDAQAGGLCSIVCSPRSAQAPSAIVVPPVALQQIVTASRPLQLAVAPPSSEGSNESPSGPDVVPPGGIDAVGSLDSGVAAWGQIAPRSSTPLPPDIAPLHPVQHAQPLPAKTEVALSTHLSLAVPVAVRLAGVPGIARDSAADGNRSLWFAPEAGR
jgi:hypothetical protein